MVPLEMVLEGILALNEKMDNTIVRVFEQQDIAILYSLGLFAALGLMGLLSP